MIRLHMIVEGQTEEGFVNSLLVEHLAPLHIFVDVRCVETSRTRSRIYRGGMLDYGRARKDLLRWMKEDQKADAYFTTMFDLFRLPQDFPEFEEAKGKPDPVARVQHLELALAEDFSHPRFLPYVQLHEFEALLLCDPMRFNAVFIGLDRAIQSLSRVVERFESPELIDDGEQTAPSKRIIDQIPEYAAQKASAGPLIAEKIGLPAMRAKCPHFNAWLERIESLSGERSK